MVVRLRTLSPRDGPGVATAWKLPGPGRLGTAPRETATGRGDMKTPSPQRRADALLMLAQVEAILRAQGLFRVQVHIDAIRQDLKDAEKEAT